VWIIPVKRLLAWTGGQSFDVDRFGHRLVANPVGVQQLPRASGRVVRLHGRFHGAGGRIQCCRVKICNSIKQASRSDEIVNLFPFNIYFWKPIASDRAAETRHDCCPNDLDLFVVQPLNHFLIALITSSAETRHAPKSLMPSNQTT